MATPLIKISEAKGNFFDSKRVTNKVDKATRDALSKIGGEIRISAKRSMEQSARAARIGEKELDPERRRKRKLANKIRKSQGKPRLKPVRRSSRPGQAPVASRSSPLNRLTFFSLDENKTGVLIGPVGFSGSNAPLTLEEGGTARIGEGTERARTVTIDQRPYMVPARKEAEPNMPRKWRNSVRGP